MRAHRRGWRPALALAALVSVGVTACGGGSPSSSPAAPAASTASALRPIGAGLRGPAGLKATIFATGLPTVSAFALDGSGRLWATTSAASDHRKDGVWLVPGAGRAPIKVVSGLSGPLGLAWVGDTLYVSSIARVQAFSGLRGTRFAHRRTIIAEPAGRGWNGALAVAPNGRLVMGISSACDHCTTTSTWSGTIVSFRPDGSDVTTYARHIRAPVGLAFVPGTSDLLVSMNQRDDLGTRTPGDALALVAEGQDWRFPGCYGQGGSACVGAPEPLADLDKHAAVGSVGVVTGQLGAAVGTAALVPEWAKGTVQRVALTRSGTTYRATVTPLLSGLTNPLALIATPDGALVGDWTTGRIYRLARA